MNLVKQGNCDAWDSAWLSGLLSDPGAGELVVSKFGLVALSTIWHQIEIDVPQTQPGVLLWMQASAQQVWPAHDQ